jgi:hypothetical protein
MKTKYKIINKTPKLTEKEAEEKKKKIVEEIINAIYNG